MEPQFKHYNWELRAQRSASLLNVFIYLGSSRCQEKNISKPKKERNVSRKKNTFPFWLQTIASWHVEVARLRASNEHKSNLYAFPMEWKVFILYSIRNDMMMMIWHNKTHWFGRERYKRCQIERNKISIKWMGHTMWHADIHASISASHTMQLRRKMAGELYARYVRLLKKAPESVASTTCCSGKSKLEFDVQSYSVEEMRFTLPFVIWVCRRLLAERRTRRADWKWTFTFIHCKYDLLAFHVGIFVMRKINKRI